jgi:hypothetical protein
VAARSDEPPGSTRPDAARRRPVTPGGPGLGPRGFRRRSRDRVVLPVQAPFVADAGEGDQAERVGGCCGRPGRPVEGRGRRPVLAPREACVLQTGSRGLLPLGLAREPAGYALAIGQPPTEPHCVEPAHPDHGLLGVVEARIMPPGGRLGLAAREEPAYSRLVTGARAMAKRSSQTRWRGRRPDGRAPSPSRTSRRGPPLGPCGRV